MDPKHEEAWLGRARTAANPKEAVGHVQRCLEINPKSERARAELKAAQERVKNEAVRLVDEGLAQRQLGNAERARSLFVQASELDPSNDRAWLESARTASDFQTAFSYAKRALEVNPDNEQARELFHFLREPEKTTGSPRFSRRTAVVLLLLVLLILILFVVLRLPTA